MEITEQAEVAPITPAPDNAIEALQNDTLNVLMGIKPSEVAETPTPEEVVPEETATPEVAPVEEVVVEPEVEIETETEQEIAEELKTPKRVRLAGSATDRALFNLINETMREEGISLAEATARYVKPAQAPVEPEVQAEAVPEIHVTPEVQELEASVATLEAELDEAGANEGLVTPDITRITKELSKANAKLEGARVRAELQAERVASQQAATQQTEAQLKAAWQSQLTELPKSYPDMANKDSFLYLTAKAITEQAKADPKHPNRADLEKPDAPRIFAELAAAKIGIKPVTATTTVVPAKQTVKPPAPAAGFRSTTPPAPPASREQLVAKAHNDALDVLGGAKAPQRTTSFIIG